MGGTNQPGKPELWRDASALLLTGPLKWDAMSGKESEIKYRRGMAVQFTFVYSASI